MSLTISEHTEARLTEEARRRTFPWTRFWKSSSTNALARRPAVEVPVWPVGVIGCCVDGISTAMSLETGVLDANVLVYTAASEATQHMASRTLLDAVRDEEDSAFYVTSQILCEFYSVVSNPRPMT